MIAELSEDWIAGVQGNVFSGYPRAHAARLMLCQVTNPREARATLRRLLPAVTFHEEAKDGSRCRLNVAFTYRGLRALGLDPAALSGLDAQLPFRQSMQRRRHMLGDAPAPLDRDAQWDDEPLDVVLLLHLDEARVEALRPVLTAEGQRARAIDREWSRDDGATLRSALAQALDDAASELGSLDGLRARVLDLHHPLVDDYGIEYFGFRDGIRNPNPLHEPSAAGAEHPASEFVLRSDDPLCDGGTFLVLRQLEQDVPRFWREVREQAPAAGLDAVELAERMMGRRRDGRALDEGAPGDLHAPAFAPGTGASRCPFGSHVRRVNPQIDDDRGVNPRIIRRGLSYLDANDKRGLLFLAFNADIAAQFEFMQRNWIQRGNSAGGTSRDFDAIAGCPLERDRRTSFSLAPDERASNGGALSFSPFVRLVAGEYAFVPARAALAFIAAEPPRQGLLADPIAAFLASRESKLKGEQKRALQRWLDHPVWSRKFWDAVLAKAQRDRVKAVRVGEYEFVADPAEVERVLRNRKKIYSMEEYNRRMAPATGEFFLGMNEYEARYRRERPTAAFLDAIPRSKVANTAERAALAVLEAAERRRDPSLPAAQPVTASLAELLATVLDGVAGEHFALPGPSVRSLASWGRDLAYYYFRLLPDEIEEAKAREASQQYRAHVLTRYALAKAAPRATPEQRKLLAICASIDEALSASLPRGVRASDDDITRTLLGIVTGSLGATMKLFTEGLLIHLAAHGDGRIHFPSKKGPLYESLLAPALYAGKRGGPDSLYRVRRDGEKEITTVVWLGGAQERDRDILFGAGDHRCPGIHIGKGMIDGLLRALRRRDGSFRGPPDQLRFEFTAEARVPA